MAKKDIRVRT